jgi:mRNA interferase RelE/StbE
VIFKLHKQVQKDLKKIKNRDVLIRFKEFLKEIADAPSLLDINGIKKIKGEKNYYRYKFGDYRAGFKLEDNQILILKVAHRKEIYRYFP